MAEIRAINTKSLSPKSLLFFDKGLDRLNLSNRSIDFASESDSFYRYKLADIANK